MQTLHIVIGSVTGTALNAARHIKANLQQRYHIKLHEYPDLDEILIAPNQLILFCVSNIGDGELPPRMRKVWVQLTEQNRDLSGHQYLMINIGDSRYRKFGLSGKILDDALRRSGATRLSGRFTIDMRVEEAPFDAALDWFSEALEQAVL